MSYLHVRNALKLHANHRLDIVSTTALLIHYYLLTIIAKCTMGACDNRDCRRQSRDYLIASGGQLAPP